MKLAGLPLKTRWEEPRGSFDKSGIGECFVQPARKERGAAVWHVSRGRHVSRCACRCPGDIARIAHNVKKNRTNDTVVCSLELFELMESLILAQDERWRRA